MNGISMFNVGNNPDFQGLQPAFNPLVKDANIALGKTCVETKDPTRNHTFDITELPPLTDAFKSVFADSSVHTPTLELNDINIDASPETTKAKPSAEAVNSTPAPSEKESILRTIANAILSRIGGFIKGSYRLIGAALILAFIPVVVTFTVIGGLIGCLIYKKNVSTVKNLAEDAAVGMVLGSFAMLKSSYNGYKSIISGKEDKSTLEPEIESKVTEKFQMTINGETKEIPLTMYRTTAKTNRMGKSCREILNDTFGRVVFFGTNRAVRTFRNFNEHRKEAVFDESGVVVGRKDNDVFSDAGLKKNKENLIKMHNDEDRIVYDLGSDKEGGLKVGDEKIDGLFIRANKDKVNVPTAIYFCGGGDFYESRQDITAYYAELGMNVLVFNYRGYGNSDGGTPSHDTLAVDAEAVYQYACKMGVDPDNIIVHGHSLGGLITGDLKNNHPEITYIADRAPSDLSDTLNLRQKQHSGMYQVLSGMAHGIIQQLGQNFSPKKRIRDLHEQGKVGRVYCIDCRVDETLFQAKIGQNLVGKGDAPEVGRKSFEPETTANQEIVSKEMERVIPDENRYVTDGILHGDNLVSVERIKTAEYLTKQNLIASTRFFFAILEDPAGSYNVPDVYKALRSWYKTILNGDDKIKAEFTEQLHTFEEWRTARSNYLYDLKIELTEKKSKLEEHKNILENGTFMDRRSSSVSLNELTEQIEAIDNRLNGLIAELNGLRAGLPKLAQWDAALPADKRLNWKLKDSPSTDGVNVPLEDLGKTDNVQL